MYEQLRYLLMQIRNQDDPMREQEVTVFARALEANPSQFTILDLLNEVPTRERLNGFDVVLLGGSGHYSAAGEGEWLERTLDGLRLVHDIAKPTFASCWGFQAMARAMGGEVINDPDRAELGVHELSLTEAGSADPVFGFLAPTFNAQMGHEDRVTRLPADATLLASTSVVENQAYRFAGKPIYATQFHPELNRHNLIERVIAYPEYVEKIAGLSLDDFINTCRETPRAEQLLLSFVRHVFGVD
jgi:GMP synthase (glutamine-hydrolysing)